VASKYSKPVYLYSLDKSLVKTFSSRVEAAKWLGVSKQAVAKAIKRIL
jgi:hypothetical protein